MSDTLVPRLIAAGANMDNVHIVNGTIENGRPRPFSFSSDIPRLSMEISQIGSVALIIIDSIVQAVPGDSNKNADVRRALEPLNDLAEKHRCAILGITHVNKSSKGKEPLERINGSLAYGAVARVVMVTSKVNTESADEAPSRCVLVRAKSNIGRDDGGFEYEIQPFDLQVSSGKISSSRIHWNSTPLHGSPRDILKRAESGDQPEAMSALELAEDFLSHMLAGGPQPASLVHDQALAAGISAATLKRAKATMGIRSEKQRDAGKASPHFWTLNSVPAPQFGSTHAPGAGFPASSFESRRASFTRPSGQNTIAQFPSRFADSHRGGVESVESVESVEPVEPVEPHPVYSQGEAKYGVTSAAGPVVYSRPVAAGEPDLTQTVIKVTPVYGPGSEGHQTDALADPTSRLSSQAPSKATLYESLDMAVYDCCLQECKKFLTNEHLAAAEDRDELIAQVIDEVLDHYCASIGNETRYRDALMACF